MNGMKEKADLNVCEPIEQVGRSSEYSCSNRCKEEMKGR